MICDDCGSELLYYPNEWPWEPSYWICPICDMVSDCDLEEEEDEH